MFSKILTLKLKINQSSTVIKKSSAVKKFFFCIYEACFFFIANIVKNWRQVQNDDKNIGDKIVKNCSDKFNTLLLTTCGLALLISGGGHFGLSTKI